ncbi:MAG: DUF1127 domain-containing protein [Pseudomonadota bacterium]
MNTTKPLTMSAYARELATVALRWLRRRLQSVASAVLRWSEIASRADEIEKLRALSDAELAQRGLRRDQIVRYVFRDRMV